MKLLFDATELSYYDENSTNRAGIFYVTLNLLNEFQKAGLDITFHCDFKRYYILKKIKFFQHIPLLKENSPINRLLSGILYLTDKLPAKIRYAFIVLARIYDKHFYITNKKNAGQLKKFDVYFSPCTPPTKEIANSKIPKFRIIHDTIPIIEKNGQSHAGDWHDKVYNTINDKDFYIANSESTRNDVLKYFPFVKAENIKTALLGANENFRQTNDASPVNGKFVFSLCSLGKRKNLEFGIRNFFSFIEKNNIQDLKLVLGGSVWNKYKKELNTILSRYDREKVILAGYIDETKLSKYYSNALCFIYPSLYEGFGLPVLEAMQCGCPVITSNVSSLPEVIGDAGIQIDPNNDTEMTDALEKMYFDSDFRRKCSQKGLKRAEHFSWEKCASEIISFIEDKLNQPVK